MSENSQSHLVKAFKSLLDTGKYSDFVITCQGDTYNVHKAVVCSMSGFLERAERFPVGRESEEEKVDLPEDDPRLVKLLIDYMYEGEYEPNLEHAGVVILDGKVHAYTYDFPHTCKPGCPIPLHLVCPHHDCLPNTCKEACNKFVCTECCPQWLSSGSLEHPVHPLRMLLHSKMYEVGDKYDVIGLKDQACDKFLKLCRMHYNDDQFAPAAHHAFTTTPEEDMGLRDVIIQIISKNMMLLNKPEIIALLHEFNGLATGILKRRAADLGWLETASTGSEP